MKWGVTSTPYFYVAPELPDISATEVRAALRRGDRCLPAMISEVTSVASPTSGGFQIISFRSLESYGRMIVQVCALAWLLQASPSLDATTAIRTSAL